ncbi:hypothetical protein [Dechloromonas hortensis]|uniref:hypothetical protein n=1 Tax=Dechloromonas hortensis TaxID=337779 RepID=UPI001290E27C|nr:hypothetical protein [Dechloromonas hortensis]
MDICLARKDLFRQPAVLGLACDYRVLLACCTVHPYRKASGVTYFDPLAATLIGFEHNVAVAGLKVLDGLGRVVFDEHTLEVFPADFFEVNNIRGQSWFAKHAKENTKNVRSAHVRESMERLRAEASELVPSLAVRLNLISSLPPRGGKVMVSDAAIALALVCNEHISAAGIGVLNVSMLAEMTAQTSAAAAQGVANVAKRGIVDVDWSTGEYRVVGWLSMPGKLDYKNQQLDAIGAALEIQSRRLKNAVKRDLERLLNTKFTELAKAFSLQSSTSCVLDFTLLHSSSLHSTQPAPASPSPSPKTKSDKGEDGDGVVFNEEEKTKAKARLQNAGWSDGDVVAILKTVLKAAKNKEAADRAVAAIAGSEPRKIRSTGAFWQSVVEKANAGTLQEPAANKHFNTDEEWTNYGDPRTAIMNRIQGATFNQEKRLKVALDAGKQAFTEAYRAIFNTELPDELALMLEKVEDAA